MMSSNTRRTRTEDYKADADVSDEYVWSAISYLDPEQKNGSSNSVLWVTEYLRLSKSQTEAIQQVMILERQKIDPLMAQLRSATEKVLAAGPEGTNEKNIKALADKQVVCWRS